MVLVEFVLLPLLSTLSAPQLFESKIVPLNSEQDRPSYLLTRRNTQNHIRQSGNKTEVYTSSPNIHFNHETHWKSQRYKHPPFCISSDLIQILFQQEKAIYKKTYFILVMTDCGTQKVLEYTVCEVCFSCLDQNDWVSWRGMR